MTTTIKALSDGLSGELQVNGAPALRFGADTSGQLPGFRNRIINGDMRIDQRNAGASQTITAGAALAYSVDRFYVYCTGANTTGQRVAGPIANTYRYQFTGAASNTAVGFSTRLEADNTAMLAGSTATLSVKLKSSSLTSITWTAYYANTKDTFGTLASPTRTQIATGSFTITSTEAVYSTNISIPAAATTGIEIVLTGGALLGSQTLTIGEVQLEPGSIATPFEHRPYGTELALCQRYYEIGGDKGTIWSGQITSGSTYYAGVQFTVAKRTSSTNVTTSNVGVSGFPTSGITVADATGFWDGRAASSTLTSGYMHFNWTASAEL